MTKRTAPPASASAPEHPPEQPQPPKTPVPPSRVNRTVIADEQALPRGKSWRYVRSGADPRALIHPWTGDTFWREDGAPWRHAGYDASEGYPARPCSLKAGCADPAADEVDAWYRERDAAAAQKAAA